MEKIYKCERPYKNMDKIILECPNFEWIPESELPSNWEELLKNNFSKIAPFYYKSIFSNEVSKKAHSEVNNKIKGIIKTTNPTSILDVGVGDGSRLIEVAPKRTNLYGIEISEEMVNVSKGKGIDTKLSDFKKRLPFPTNSIDLILFLSNDFGYVMNKNPSNSVLTRISVLNEVYRILKPNGRLYMELMSQDTGDYNSDGLVCKYKRILKINDKEIFKGDFYLKDFKFYELSMLFDLSLFKGSKIEIEYMLSKDFENPNDLNDVGKIIKSFSCFQGYSINDFQPNLIDYKNRYDYFILLNITK